MGVWARERVFLDDQGAIRQRIEIPQKQTSWSAIYQALRQSFPAANYHKGANLKAVSQQDDGVVATFEDGRTAQGDLLIGADGWRKIPPCANCCFPASGSTTQAMLGKWRGLVAEADIDETASLVLRDRFAFYELQGSHMLSYLVAGEGVGSRRYNWVWYRLAGEVSELSALLTDREGRHT